MDTDEMRAMRARGVSVAAIASAAGIGAAAVYARLSKYEPMPANDNRPGVRTISVTENGGTSMQCRTVPISVADGVPA